MRSYEIATEPQSSSYVEVKAPCGALILHDWPFQPKLDGVRARNAPAAQYGSSPASPLEGAGFEPSVPLVPARNAP